MKPVNMLEALIDSDVSLACIQTPKHASLIKAFSEIAADSGRAMYLWTPEKGLARMGIEHIPIPHSTDLGQAVRHINSTVHYGIYIVHRPGQRLQNDERTIASIRRYAVTSHRSRHLIIFVDETLRLADELRPLCQWVSASDAELPDAAKSPTARPATSEAGKQPAAATTTPPAPEEQSMASRDLNAYWF